MMRRVLVTGAAGFLGWNLVQYLLAQGFFVEAIVRPASKSNARLLPHPHLRVVPLAMEEIAHLPEHVTEPLDSAVHLAWDPRRMDMSVQMESLSAAVELVTALGIIGCRRFLGIGSQAEYGNADDVMREDAVPHPVTPYGAAKVAVLHLTRVHAAVCGMDWMWGRVFSVYGTCEPATTLLASLAAALRRGETMRMTAGTQMWDYLYAADAAAAMTALLTHGRAGEVYNIAHGDVRPMRSFTEEMRALLAPDAVIAYGTADRAALSLRPTVEKIAVHTGWRAATSFAEGVRRTYLPHEGGSI